MDCESGCKAPVHQVDQDGRESAFDHVAAHAPNDRLLPFARRGDRSDNGPQSVSGQDVRQACKQAIDAGSRLIHVRKIGLLHLAAAFGERYGFQSG